MALTKAQRAARRAEVLQALRGARRRRRHPFVELRLQDGRRRPRVTGRVRTVATSGAFVLLDSSDRPADRSLGEDPAEPLHVPVDVIRSVHTL